VYRLTWTWIVTVMGPDAVLISVLALNASAWPLVPEVWWTPGAADSIARPISIRDETDTEASFSGRHSTLGEREQSALLPL
jgi:hypothetical protein